MTKKRCPLGEACDLTTAWMLGAARARDNISAGHLHLQLKVNRVGGAYIEDDEGMELDCVTMDGAFNLRAVAEGLRQGPDRVAPLEAEVKAQAAEIERLRDEVDRLRNAAAVVVVIHREAKEFGSFRSTKFITALSLAVSDLNDTLTGGKDE